MLRVVLMAYDGDGVAAMACRCEGVFVAQTPSTRLAACGAVLSVRGSYAIDATRRDGVEGKKRTPAQYRRAVREVAHAKS